MLEYLPQTLFNTIYPYIDKGLNELRIRADKPALAIVSGKSIDLGVKVSAGDITKIILALTKHSVYGYEDVIKKGYLIGSNGERVGLCGECVTAGGEVRFIKNVTSLCIRVHKEVKTKAREVSEKVFSDGIKNLLIVSPPACGKTTMLRDFAKIISNDYGKNVLIVDEKCEIAPNSVNLGDKVDVLYYCDKSFGISCGLLNMHPDVIIVDEIFDLSTLSAVCDAALSGVYIITSAHGKSVDSVRARGFLEKAFENDIFDYCVLLSNKNGAGTLEKVVKLD